MQCKLSSLVAIHLRYTQIKYAVDLLQLPKHETHSSTMADFASFSFVNDSKARF
jgi:hypothetical protein